MADGNGSAKAEPRDRLIVDSQLVTAQEFRFPTREASEFQPFEGTLTGTGSFKIWDANKSANITLRGGYIGMLVSQAFQGSDYGFLRIIDEENTLIMPLSPFCPDMPAGYMFGSSERPWLRFDLLEGHQANVDAVTGDSNLYISPSVTIGTGVVKICSVCWGMEQTT